MQNNIGLIRLFLALLVIVSHSAELVDGNRSRELLTRVFHTMSFGEVAVAGFFLVSGYLITKSYLQSRSVADYVIKRVLRIYPGYVAAYLVTFLIVGPLSGATLPGFNVSEIEKTTQHILLLEPPELPGSFADLPYGYLNGAMWTIGYEFRCYLLIIFLGLTRILYHKKAIILLVFVLLCLEFFHAGHPVSYLIRRVFGEPLYLVRFIFLFLCGMSFFVFKDRIRYTTNGAIGVGLLLFGLMFLPALAEPAVATFGGYLLFWLAFQCPMTRYSRLDGKLDISYGLYLYAWPVQQMLIQWDHGITPWQVMALTSLIALPLALLSWFAVEKPCIHLRNAWRVSYV